MQKPTLITAVVCIILLAGCATRPSVTKPTAPPGTTTPRNTVAPADNLVEPDTMLVGHIIKVNVKAQFVLISFPIGCLPRPEQPLYVYRNSRKVGELKATRHMLDELVIADIVSGECTPGDEVADK